MHVRRWLTVIAAGAALHAAFFISYQAPEWPTVADQEGYRRLGQALAESGRFTRFPDAPVFVPEVIRTPGYPLFLAAVYSVAGTSQMAVVVAQAALFVLMVVLGYWLACRCAPAPVPIIAAALIACYPTFPYFAALAMTELWTTFVLLLAMLALISAYHTGRTKYFVIAGALLGYTALSRPAFVLLPVAFVAIGLMLFWRSWRDTLRPWVWVVGAFALVLLPWLTFNYMVMGRFVLAPAGGVGRGLWEGSWHGYWPGRVQNELTQLAAQTADDAVLDQRVDAFAATHGYDATPMRIYVHQWKDIRRIWDEPTDPQVRAVARVAADREYQRVGTENIRADVAGHIVRRLTHGAPVLWTTDIWLRYSRINDAPVAVIRAMWTVQALVLLCAAWGIRTLLIRRRLLEAWLLVTPLLYVTAVHVPLLTEARQSLPVKPLVLVLAAVGIAELRTRLISRQSAGS